MPLEHEEKERLKKRRLHKRDLSHKIMGIEYYWTCPKCELVLSYTTMDRGERGHSRKREEEPYLEEAKLGHISEHEDAERAEKGEQPRGIKKQKSQIWRSILQRTRKSCATRK